LSKGVIKMEDGSQYLHPDALNNINKSEIEGGVYSDIMEDGDYLIETQNTLYTLTKSRGKFTLMGNERLCPSPREVNIHGSTWGGSMIKINFIGRGMRLEVSFCDEPDKHLTILTTSIKEITKL